MSIAVVIPAYNAEATLGRALASMRSQRRAPDEVIVVDDGSTDTTAEVARREGRELPLKLVQQENGGLCAARNAGTRAAASPRVAFLDADDAMLPGALAALSALFEEAPEAVLAFGDARVVDPDGTLRIPSKLEARLVPGLDYDPAQVPHRLRDPVLLTMPGNFVSAGAFAVDREVLLRAGGFNEQLRRAVDREFFLRFAAAGPWVFTLEQLAVIHYSPSSMSGLANQWRHAEAAVLALQTWRAGAGALSPEHESAFNEAVRFASHRALYYGSLDGPGRVIALARRLPPSGPALVHLGRVATALMKSPVRRLARAD